MGSTVSANGLVVATSTSGHFATSVPGDMRLVGQKVPTLLPNFVESKKIYSAYPSLTRFGSGLIWVEGTKAGPKSDPIDTWPGVVIPSAINSYATSKPGSGSNNVYAEAKRVYCFTHDTLQNEGNSSGKLLDKPLMVTGNNDGEGEGEGQSLLDGDGNSDSDGESEGEDGNSDEGSDKDKKDGEGKVPEGECTLQSATVTDPTGGRAQSQEENDTAYLQMVPGKAKFSAKIDKPCTEQHPEWDIDGTKTKAADVEHSVRSGASLAGYLAGSISGLIDIWRIGTQDPKVYTGVISTHHGTKTRIVHCFPGDEAKREIELVKGLDAPKVMRILTFGGKLPNPSPGVEVKTMELKFEVKLQWTEEPDWKCPLVASIGFSRTFLAIEGRKYFNLEFLAAIPVVGWIIGILYRVNDAIRAVNSSRVVKWLGFQIPVLPVPQGYVRAKLEFKISLFVKIKKFHHQTPFLSQKEKSAQIVWGENFSAGVEIELGVGISLGRAGEGIFACGGEIFVATSFAGKHVEHRVDFVLGKLELKGRLWMTYDLLSVVPARWRESADSALQVFGVKLKDEKKLDSNPFELTSAETVVFSIPLK